MTCRCFKEPLQRSEFISSGADGRGGPSSSQGRSSAGLTGKVFSLPGIDCQIMTGYGRVTRPPIPCPSPTGDGVHLFCLPVTEAVRVQLYRMASSPNTFPWPMVQSFFPCLVTSTIPSEDGEFKKKRKKKMRLNATWREEMRGVRRLEQRGGEQINQAQRRFCDEQQSKHLPLY